MLCVPKNALDIIGVYLFALMARDVTTAKFVLWRLNKQMIFSRIDPMDDDDQCEGRQ